MVFLSEASVRELVQEALGGGSYPSLDGDGTFPIIPSPLAEPIVTKLAIQPVRVMRVPTDRAEFELAVSELVDGVEQDHLPTLFLKLRELVADFAPVTQEAPCPPNCSCDKCSCNKDDEMAKTTPPNSDEMNQLRSEVRKLVHTILEEVGDDEDAARKQDDEETAQRIAKWKADAARRASTRRTGPDYNPWGVKISDEPEDDEEETWHEDYDDDFLSMDDPGLADDDPTEPYPEGWEEYLKNPGYPEIGGPDEDEFTSWEDLEKEISGSAWEPEQKGSDEEEDKPQVKRKADPISKVAMSLDDIQKDPDFQEMGTSTIHGYIAKAARKLGFASELSTVQLDNLLDTATDEYIDHLIKKGAEKGEDGKPLLSFSDVMDLRAASKFEQDEEGRRIRKSLDKEGEMIRRAIQELDGFRDFLHPRMVDMMEKAGYAYQHRDAAKDKDKHSIIHRMKGKS